MQSNQFSSQTSESKKAKTLTIISALVLVLAVAITSLAAYYWQQERYTTDSLRERISELESGSDASSDSTGTAGKLCGTNTAQFTASVGRFTLNLPDDNYVIIKNHDGAGEGGNATQVSVGKCLNAAENTVEFSTNEEVVLRATPASNWEGTSFSDWASGRAAADGGEVQELENGTVAAVATREYAVQGLGETRKTYYENNGIWYELTAYNATDGSPALSTRSAVVEGFSFVE